MPGCARGCTGFPDGWGLGKCVPEFAFVMGCGFRLRALVENTTRNLQSEWDAVSQRSHKRKLHPIPDVNSGTRFPDAKKGHMTWPSTYICSADVPMTSRVSTPRRLPGDAECKVHREFRTSRRALNVLSVRAGNLICLRPDRRFSYELAASRYLILVVPGARLGSVSLASVWKCSVYTFLPSRNIS